MCSGDAAGHGGTFNSDGKAAGRSAERSTAGPLPSERTAPPGPAAPRAPGPGSPTPGSGRQRPGSALTAAPRKDAPGPLSPQPVGSTLGTSFPVHGTPRQAAPRAQKHSTQPGETRVGRGLTPHHPSEHIGAPPALPMATETQRVPGAGNTATAVPGNPETPFCGEPSGALETVGADTFKSPGVRLTE